MAIAGHNRAQRVGPEPLTRAEFEDLEAAYPDNRSIKAQRAFQPGTVKRI